MEVVTQQNLAVPRNAANSRRSPQLNWQCSILSVCKYVETKNQLQVKPNLIHISTKIECQFMFVHSPLPLYSWNKISKGVSCYT
jgi:hypothetical protein